MSLATEMQSDIARGPERDAPARFTWAGSSFPCSITTKKKRRILEPGGFEIDVQFALRIRLDARDTNGTLFSDKPFPKHGQQLAVTEPEELAATYSIEAVDDSLGAWLKIDLKDATQ